MSEETKTPTKANPDSAAATDGPSSEVACHANSCGSADDSTALGQTKRPVFVRPVYHSSKVDGEWQIAVVMPGVNRKDVSVAVEKDELTIFGRRSDSVPEGWSALYEGRHKADYRLALQLNFAADPERISARLEDGILTVDLPEHEAAKPRHIEVK